LKPYILGIDPSGSFDEGKGTTGLCLFDVANNDIITSDAIYASKFKTAEDYWMAHTLYLDNKVAKCGKDNIVISIEDFLIYANKAKSLTNSTMETSQLIGVLKMWCKLNNIPYTIRPAVIVKKRWSNEVLEHKGYIYKVGRCWYNKKGQPLVEHTLDAIRHTIHCYNFENKEEKYVR
jgi:hypothetical protein